jgi:N-acetylmuramoyl-L-alanine amidase
MRSCDKALARGSAARVGGRVLSTAVAVSLLVCVVSADAQTARARYLETVEKDEQVRLQLTNFTSKAPAADLLTQVAQVVTSFEGIVRRFPTSGYADDALWQAASLADAAYQRFNRGEDRDRALKIYRWLIQEYPKSTFVKHANAKVATLAKTAPTLPAAVPAVATAPPPLAPLVSRPLKAAAFLPPAADRVAYAVPASPSTPVAPAASVAPAPPDRATLTAISRVVLPASVRITLELDREVMYHEERIAGPARLFFDLKNVQPSAPLMDKVLSYSSDVVNKVRVGRHPDNTVRVVLDFEGVSRYSVFTLYSPFRLVIDAERVTATPASKAATLVVPAPPPPAAEPKKPAIVEKPVVIAEEPMAPPTPENAPAAVSPASPPAIPTAPSANSAGGFSMARQLGLSVSRIVIDPGHGGHDPGTPAKGLNEADLTLDIALRLEKLLQKEAGVEVVLTRRTDVYVPLEERTAIANRSNADLFLSIHANSSRNVTAKGIETYFLSFASSPEAEAIAARENSASEREMHQLPDIIKAISLNNKLDESRDLANMVQNSLVTTLAKSNKEVRGRGVKKAPFVVLIGAAMPSVLAEISFITNKQELQLLKTAAYKDKIALALYNAVLKYRRSLKGTAATTLER